MSLVIEGRQGIRLGLGQYRRIRSYQGGGEFWEHQNQQVLMQHLEEFLPRAVETTGGGPESILYTYLVQGKELLSESSALGEKGQGAPAAQLKRLQEAVARLKAKESDPLIDPNARKLIEAFRLPDPTKDPELYRISKSSPRRLLVLWGVEKEHDSSLPPQAAVQRIQVAKGYPLWLMVVLGLLLLLLFLLLISWLMDKPTGVSSRTGQPLVTALPPSGNDPGKSGAAQPGNSSATSPMDSSRHGGIQPSRSETPNSSSASRPPDGSGAPGSGPAGASAPGSPSRSVQPPGSRPSNPLNASGGSSPAPSSQPSLPSSQSSSPSPSPSAAPSIPPTPSPSNVASPAPSPDPPSLRLEIANTRTSSESRDGKVEVLLTATGRDLQERPVAVSNPVRWLIDGDLQKDGAGQVLTGTALPVALTKGMHRVIVEGTDPAGNRIRAEADVEVGIQVTEKTDVKVRPNR